MKTVDDPSRSDGSTASYYQLPGGADELQHLISYKNMNAQIGEIFRSSYRFGESSHIDQLRDAKKIQFYLDSAISSINRPISGATFVPEYFSLFRHIFVVATT